MPEEEISPPKTEEETSPPKTEEGKKPKEGKKPVAAKKKGGWFQKIPTDVILSPGGMVLIFFALFMEAMDAVLPSDVTLYLDQIIEIPLEIIFMIMLVVIAKVSVKSLIIPWLIERIPEISDYLPTWLIRLLM